MRYLDYGVCLVLLAISMVSGVVYAVANSGATEIPIRAELYRVAYIERESPEATSVARNKQLNETFRAYVALHDGQPTAELVQQFNGLLKEQQFTNFDDFLAVMIRPVVYVTDRATGSQVPVFGPLGSDVINPWLAAAAVIEEVPLDEQPMYHSAIRALNENLDFAVIGIQDPNLSLDLLPAELHENARAAYARLNPTNRFDGGFDHPLFYCVVREAAEKFFREDHPQAKLDMADLVAPVAQGGLGIQSCLLCHERDYNGVYRRLFAQGTYLSTKANELREAQKQGLPCADDPAKVQADAEMFLLAADRVVREYPDKIDEDAVRESLLKQTGDNCERLKPGYDDFVVVLDRLGCLQCHSTQAKVGDKLDPACYGAFVLDCNAYNKSVNVRALSQHIDFDNVAQSQLLAKAANRVDHEGAARVKLDQSQLDELSGALAKWLRAYSNGVSPRSDGNSPVSAVPVAAASLVQRTAPQERPAAPQP